MEDAKKAIEEFKEKQSEFGTNGKACFENKKHMPTDCYEKVFGVINYTATERKAWEGKMTGYHNDEYFKAASVDKKNQK